MDLHGMPRDVLGEILLGPVGDERAVAQRHVWPPYAFLQDLQRATDRGTVDEGRMVLVVVAQSVCRSWRDVVQKAVLKQCCAPLDFFTERCIRASTQTDSLIEWAERNGCLPGDEEWLIAMKHGRLDLSERLLGPIQQLPPLATFADRMATVYTEHNAERMHRLIHAASLHTDQAQDLARATTLMVHAAARKGNLHLLRWVTQHPNCALDDVRKSLPSVAATSGSKDAFEYACTLCNYNGPETPELATELLRSAMMSKNGELVRHIVQKYGLELHGIEPVTAGRATSVEMLEFIRTELPHLDVLSGRFVVRLLDYCLDDHLYDNLEKQRRYFQSIRQWLATVGLTIPPTHVVALMLADTEEAVDVLRQMPVGKLPSIRQALLLGAWNTAAHLATRPAPTMFLHWIATDTPGFSIARCQRLVDAGLWLAWYWGAGELRYAPHDLVTWIKSTEFKGVGARAAFMSGSRLLGARPLCHGRHIVVYE